jgi:hypothetical protein
MINEVTPGSPVLIPESLVIYPDGELRKGLYYYVITALADKESIPSHILQVYAPNKENSISFEWLPIEGAEVYRIYRGTTLGHYDGYFDLSPNSCYFCDNGIGLLQEDICQ